SWMVVHDEDRYQIDNLKKGGYLHYQDQEEYSRLIVSKIRVLWELVEIDNEVIIRVPDSDLVIGTLPARIFPPLAGLTLPSKSPHLWKLEPIHSAQLANIPEGDVEIVLYDNMFLSEMDEMARL